MKHSLGGVIAAAWAAALAGCGGGDGTRMDPDTVRFGGRDYRVTATHERIELVAADDRVVLEAGPTDRRHLAPCPRPRLIVTRIDGDDAPDLARYDCGWLEVYLDRGAPLSRTEPIEGKRKEGRWVHLDPTSYRLGAIEKLLPQIDPD